MTKGTLCFYRGTRLGALRFPAHQVGYSYLGLPVH
jgi:hypothetical protein